MTSMSEQPNGDANDTPPGDEANGEAVAPTAEEVIADDPATAMIPITAEREGMRNILAYGRQMHRSGFFPDVKSEAQAVVKILAGRELGFSLIESMTGIHIIDGKPVVSAHFMAAGIKDSPKYDYKVTHHTDIAIAIDFFEIVNGEPKLLGVSEFSIEDAKNANILGHGRGKDGGPSMWEKYPRNMLFARAMSNGYAWFCPDVFRARLYTPDEVDATVEIDERGDIIDGTFAEPNEPDEKKAESKTNGEPAQEKPPPKQRERAAVPENLETVQDLTRWANIEHSLQPAQVAEHLGVERVGEIALTVQDSFGGDYNDARDHIANKIAGPAEIAVDDEDGEPEPNVIDQSEATPVADAETVPDEGQTVTPATALEAPIGTMPGDPVVPPPSEPEPTPPQPRAEPPSDEGAQQAGLGADA